MTRPLRQRHRRVALVLAVVLPLVWIAGLLARRPVPVMSGDVTPLDAHPPRTSPR